MLPNIINANPTSSCRDLQGELSLTAIPELSLDLDGLKEIYCHPDNVEMLREALEKYSPKISDFIAFAHPIKIVESAELDKTQSRTKPDGSPKWKRGKTLPDTPLVTWVEDLENPTSWQIYFGLVEQDEVPVFYGIHMGKTWSWNNKPSSLHQSKPRRIAYSKNGYNTKSIKNNS